MSWRRADRCIWTTPQQLLHCISKLAQCINILPFCQEDCVGGRMITRLQVRLARTALGWGVRDLARRAGVSTTTVTRFENGAHTRVDTLGQIQDVLERAGSITALLLFSVVALPAKRTALEP